MEEQLKTETRSEEQLTTEAEEQLTTEARSEEQLTTEAEEQLKTGKLKRGARSS